MGALTVNRQPTTMAQSAVTTNVHQSFDVQLNLFAQIAFNVTALIHNGANAVQFFLAQIPNLLIHVYLSFTKNAGRARLANSVDVSQTDLSALLRW